LKNLEQINNMTQCEKYEMFINDHTDIAMKFMIWETSILPLNNKNQEDDNTGISDIDFDIIS